MTRYSRPAAEQAGDLVGTDRICSSCGRRVSTEDPFCSGCGVAFGGIAARVDQSRGLPGFNYHFVQGFGWGLGFALAAATIAAIFFTLLCAVLFVLAAHR
jgi:hypothetical protein